MRIPFAKRKYFFPPLSLHLFGQCRNQSRLPLRRRFHRRGQNPFLEGEVAVDGIVVSLSAEDVQKVRQVLMGAIERSKKVIKESPAETLYGFCVDLFPVS